MLTYRHVKFYQEKKEKKKRLILSGLLRKGFIQTVTFEGFFERIDNF